MQREEMIQALLAAGCNPDVVNGMDDLQLAEMLKLQQGGQAPPGEQPPPESEATATPPPEGSAPPDEGSAPPPPEEEQKEKPSMFAEMGKDDYPSVFNEMCKTYKEKFGEEFSPAPPAGTDKSVGPAQFSEASFKRIVRETIQAEFGPLRKQVNGLKDDTKRERIATFCETELRAGRISASEMDATAGPTLADRLLALDDKTGVHKFSEGGKEKSLTALDAELRAIRKRPSLYKGEQVKAGLKGVEKFAEGVQSNRREQVSRFAEEHNSTLAKIGMKPAEFLSAWDAADESAKQELEAGVGL